MALGWCMLIVCCSFFTVVDVAVAAAAAAAAAAAVDMVDAGVVQEGCACPGRVGRPFSFSMGASLTSRLLEENGR